MTRKPFTVTEVARQFERTSSRIRQICRQHNIGTVLESSFRILTEDDVKKIKKVIDSDGRKK